MTNPRVRSALSGQGDRLVTMLDRIGLGAVGQAVLSAIYNATYYQGLAEELGSFDDFLAMAPTPAPIGQD
jgi:hypothetical protein